MGSPERTARSSGGPAKGTRDAAERSSLSSRIDRLEARLGQFDELEARVSVLEKNAIANTTERQRLLRAKIQSELGSYKIEGLEEADMEDLAAHVAARPNLPSLLAEAANELQMRFQSRCLVLRSTDERFLLEVETDLEVDEAERQFSAFLRDWWNKKIELEDRMSITLRYV
ncbi:MAG TPA: hypothetical protein VF469_32430 [Kofleriaceae bacterium]